MSKVCILDLGHARRGSVGAVGHIDESKQDRILGYKIKGYLEQMGWTVHVIDNDYCADVNTELRAVINQANKYPKDALFVALHFNAGGGIGMEIYTYNGQQIVPAVKVINNVRAIGGPLRKPSIKNGSGLYVIRKSKQIAMLIEVAFVDNKKDADHYFANEDKYARAIAEGIAQGKLPNVTTPPSTPKPENKPAASTEKITKTGKVNANGGLNVRSSASTSASILGALANGAKVEIYSTSGGWHKIKYGSKKGYVSEKYVKLDGTSKPATPTKKLCNVNPNKYNGWVKRLQAELNKQGFRDARGYKLTVDGYAGQRTLEAAAKTLIKQGAKGNISKLLQEMLVSLGYGTNGVDGIFGAGSNAALRAYQKDAKLSVDGIAGKATWKKLLGL